MKTRLVCESLNEMYDENFKKWFGNSKVVDRNGDPLIVYHGTRSKFNEFKPSKSIGNQRETDQIKGMYFTDNKEGALFFSLVDNDPRYLKSVYLSMQNPYFIESSNKLKDELDIKKLGDAEFKLRKLGYDGIIMERGFYAHGGLHKLFLVFEPGQIRSSVCIED